MVGLDPLGLFTFAFDFKAARVGIRLGDVALSNGAVSLAFSRPRQPCGQVVPKGCDQGDGDDQAQRGQRPAGRGEVAEFHSPSTAILIFSINDRRGGA